MTGLHDNEKSDDRRIAFGPVRRSDSSACKLADGLQNGACVEILRDEIENGLARPSRRVALAAFLLDMRERIGSDWIHAAVECG